MSEAKESEDIVEYLTKQIRVAYTTLAWQKGLFCLRCDPLGLPCIHTESKDQPWCPYCGKDPLFHGPELRDRVFFDVKVDKDRPKWQGLRPALVIQDELYQEVFDGSGTTTTSDRSGREPFQR